MTPVTTVDDDPDRRRDRRRTVLACLGVVVLVGAVYVGAYLAIGDRLPAGTRIAGVAVGGETPADARSRLSDSLAGRSADPVRLVSGEREFEVDPAEAGLDVDVAASVRQAGGGASWNPVRMLRTVVGSSDVDPVVEVDGARLSSSVATIADAVDRPVVEAQITFEDGEPQVREPVSGIAVDRAATADLVVDRFLAAGPPADVPTEETEPAVDADAVDEELETFARPAMSGPVTMRVGDQSLPLPVGAYETALTVDVVDGALVPTVDPEELAGGLADATGDVGREARDATVRLEDGVPTVVPARKGVSVDPEKVATDLVPALSRSGGERSVAVETTETAPKVTTATAKGWGITEQVSTFSTQFPYAEYRNVNQSRAAALIDGTVLAPGETFSFNDTVGERTEANGFTGGTIIDEGVFREALGGGVSQVVTTTYNAAFFAGLEDVEHKPHSFYISRYPVGREATVAWPTVDLKFKNDTDHGVLISASVRKSTPGTQGEATVSMWSTKTWDIEAGVSERRNLREPGRQTDSSDACVPQQGVTGFDVTVFRYFSKGGERVRTEEIPASYNAADTVVCQ